jgi:LPS export ABC transporter protein LptC
VIYRIFAILTVAAVIIGSLMLAQQNTAPQTPTAPQAGSDEGYSARDARLIQTGPDGLPLYTLEAAAIRQLPATGRVRLSQVRMSVQNGADRWTATADRGEILRGSNRIELDGHVRVSAAIEGSRSPIRIATDRLSFNSRVDTVSTADPVTLTWSGQRVDARGLVADLKTHRLQLESLVHAILTPAH